MSVTSLVNNLATTSQTAVRTSYNVRVWVEEQSKPQYNGDRLVIVRFKETKSVSTDGKVTKTNAIFPSLCVSVPAIQLTVEPSVLKDALTNAFYEMQKLAIANAIKEQHDAGVRIVSDLTIAASKLTPEGIAAGDTNERESARLSTDKASAWFDTNMAEKFTIAVAQKLGWDTQGHEVTEEQIGKLEAACDQHRKAISALASPRTFYSPTVAASLLRAVGVVNVGEEDRIGTAIVKRLQVMANPPKSQDDLLVSL